MAYTISNFLDMREALVTNVAGGILLFLLLSHIILFYLFALFRFENKTILLYLILWNLILAAVLTPATLILVIVFIALIYAPRIKRLFER